jgi:DNA-binding transcriptional MerR regulator
MQGMKLKTPRILKRKQSFPQALPTVPDKRYFTIGEVARLCVVMPHVLRYWESEFSQLKPMKRRGNRRCYQYDDVLIARKIRKLLYEDGFTIEGARIQLHSALSEINQSVKNDPEVKKLIADLEGILQELKTQKV